MGEGRLMEVLHFNRKELHRCYDLLKAGICLVKAGCAGNNILCKQGTCFDV